MDNWAARLNRVVQILLFVGFVVVVMVTLVGLALADAQGMFMIFLFALMVYILVAVLMGIVCTQILY